MMKEESKSNQNNDENKNENTEENIEETKDEPFEITPDMIIWKAMYLPDPIVRAVWELGFQTPTAIQLACLPTAMKGRKDIVGAAETGSGKTLAFGIPILNGILKDKEFELKKLKQNEEESEDSDDADDSDENNDDGHTSNKKQRVEKKAVVAEEDSDDSGGQMEDFGGGIGRVRVFDVVELGNQKTKIIKGQKKLRALIITPTRELAVQIEKHLKAVAKYTDISICLVIGGMAAPKQERILSKGPDIVIGTPGRLWEMIEGGNSHLSQIKDIRYLALDETDRLLEKGHFAEVRTLLEHINKDEEKKRWRQNFVFSATLTLAHDLPNRLGNLKSKKKKEAMKLDKLLSLVGVRPKAKVVDLTTQVRSLKPASLSEMKLYSATVEDKDYYLYYFLRHNPGRTLVFCNSINNVRRLTSVFTLLETNPLPLHAQMHQKQRLKHLERFSSLDNALLIATDVAARGLDIPHVQHVVHFQVPRTSENYVHRSGRTARASREGLSLILIEPEEATTYRKLCSTLKKDKNDLPDYDVDMRIFAAIKQRVNLAKAIESLEHRTKRERSDKSWMKQMAEEADLVISESDQDSDSGSAAQSHSQLLTELKNKRKELTKLLARPFKRSVK
ncbi:ATP-dependent RNA helicase DDX24-like [Daphnia pulex]|uniref:ATP-dependent RNA helicase DDX24-like n=1 Tax=Daphnia pulex TaxID=6669 RepID=UPI001EDE082D|nr:ATP-dependent RNA helicase DDX24-like [Daphnia pulex]